MAKDPVKNNTAQDKQSLSSGLFVVATPIGNLQDISARALDVLSRADLVVAEDTRHTQHLLRHHGIQARLSSLHEHNEDQKVEGILTNLRKGQSVALVSDAGTPLISDPGYRLLRAVRDAGLPVHAVPGPSAVTAALSVSGLPTDRFLFEGFLPNRASARRAKFEALAQEPRTLVFFESSHRIVACLEDLAEAFGEGREIALCRELTKQFETVLRGSALDIMRQLQDDENQQKGEFVLVCRGNDIALVPELAAAVDLARALLDELPASRAARVAARITGANRREIFAALGD